MHVQRRPLPAAEPAQNEGGRDPVAGCWGLAGSWQRRGLPGLLRRRGSPPSLSPITPCCAAAQCGGSGPLLSSPGPASVWLDVSGADPPPRWQWTPPFGVPRPRRALQLRSYGSSPSRLPRRPFLLKLRAPPPPPPPGFEQTPCFSIHRESRRHQESVSSHGLCRRHPPLPLCPSALLSP